jgi:hypothetical protein
VRSKTFPRFRLAFSLSPCFVFAFSKFVCLCSATSGSGLDEGFDWLAAKIGDKKKN